MRVPKLGRSYAHLRPDVLGLSLRGFIILYKVSNNDDEIGIEILRIVNGRRDLENIFDY